MAQHRPPSRIKYEQSHPNVTVRLSKDLKKYLDSISAATGKSYAILVREGLENQIFNKLFTGSVAELSPEEISLVIQKLGAVVTEVKKQRVKTG